MTPNTRVAVSALRTRFDLLYGIYNPRHIGSNPMRPWSQHAAAEPAKRYFGNAIDIAHQDWGYSTNTKHQAELDKVYTYLDTRRDELNIRQILWRVRNHFNHIHVDFWPKMADNWWRKHPTKGGPVVVVYENGDKGDTYGELVPPPPPPEEEPMTLQAGDSGNAVRYYQKAINAWEGDLTVDGKYGFLTERAVKEYQVAADLESTGVIDGVTGFLLGRYGLPEPEVQEAVQFEVETVEVVKKVRVL